MSEQSLSKMKYTVSAADRVVCSVCGVRVNPGSLVYKYGDWEGTDPHLWQCLKHLDDPVAASGPTGTPEAVGDLLAYGEQERESARIGKDREQYQFWSGWSSALQRLTPAARLSGESSFEKNGIRLGERVVCIDVPRLHGTVIRCAPDGVDVRWDDGKLGELAWRQDVVYNAYRLQIIRGESSTPAQDEIKRAFVAGWDAHRNGQADAHPPNLIEAWTAWAATSPGRTPQEERHETKDLLTRVDRLDG